MRLLVAEHTCAFLAADRLLEVVGLHFDDNSLIARLQALGTDAKYRVGLRRKLLERFENQPASDRFCVEIRLRPRSASGQPADRR